MGQRKSIILTLVIVIAIIAAGAVVYFMLNNRGSDDSQEASGEEQSLESSIEESRVLTTVPTRMSGFDFELMAPSRNGDTIVFNYNLINNRDDAHADVTGVRTGIYTSGESGLTGKSVPEAYLVASDGKRYGLVMDEAGEPLVSDRIGGIMEPGQKVGGFFTFDLPPAGSTVTLYAGSMQAITGIKINY